MTDEVIRLSTDASNTGKYVRTNQRTVGSVDVQEHYMILQDATNNFQAQIISGNVNTATGLAVWAIQAGSYNTYGTITTGSEVYIKAGSIQTYSSIGIGSVQLVPGSLEVYQLTNSNLQVQATQETSPWIVSGTSTVAGSVFVIGSINLVNQLGSTLLLSTPGSVAVYGTLGASGTLFTISGIVNIGVGSLSITNFAALGSSTIITNFGDLGSQVTVSAGSIRLLSTTGSIGIYQVGSAWGGTGSVHVVNPSTASITGSIEIFSSTGSVAIYGDISTSNPSVYKYSGNTVLPGSVTLVAGDFNGSAYALKLLTGSNLLTVGSIYHRIAGSIVDWPGSLAISNFNALGSSVLVTNFGDLGSQVTVSAGSIRLITTTGSVGVYAGANTIFGISGAIVGISGIVNQGTTPWAVSGNALGVSGTAFNTVWLGVGSVKAEIMSSTGSIGVYDADNGGISVEPNRGVFRYSGLGGGPFLGSFGPGSNLITPGAGSKMFLKGFTASAESATRFSLVFSGGTSTSIGQWVLPNSGTVAMNMLGMEPSGATNQSIMVGVQSSTGSLYITVFGKESL